MRLRISFGGLVLVILTATLTAFAHPPYERNEGTIKRTDGMVVSIVRRNVDGIFGADPVSIHFRLPGGTGVTNTSFAFDAVVRTVDPGAEIYQYSTTWLPISTRVELFDGYELKDVTSSRLLRSVWIHFSGHWITYLAELWLGLIFILAFRGLAKLPSRGWYSALWCLVFLVLSPVVMLWAYDLLVFEPVSPLILVACWVICLKWIDSHRRTTDAACA